MTRLGKFYVHNRSTDSLVKERRQPDKELVALWWEISSNKH